MNNKINQKTTLITFFVLLFIPAGIDVYAEERPFITTWSIGSDKTLEIPTTGGGYNYTIDWGDGIIDTAQTGNAVHTYENTGSYTISISGDFPRIYLYFSDSAMKLITVDQWGDIEWASMNNAFYGAVNMNVMAFDVPDLSRVTDMFSMFGIAQSFNGDISNWDVSSVTDMNRMFFIAGSFNGDISNWDVSSVTDMRYMFSSADSFNGDISNWDVSSVTIMNGMFYGTGSFNGDISNWDVSSVRSMHFMFAFVDSFNGDISNWDVSNVTTMGRMFEDADPFNGDISNWDTSSVTDMYHMFSGAQSFNGDISNWDTSNVTDMNHMFYHADSFNGDISNWDVSNVTDMSNMLINTTFSTDNYNKLLDNWSNLHTLQNNVILDSSSKYCNAGEIGRNIIIDTYDWIISDEGKDTVGNCGIQNIDAPIIISLVADDPDDLDNVYSAGDTITITFDSDTNEPGGTGTQTKTAVNDLYIFTESLGETYTGQWNTTDTFVITITNATGVSPPIMGSTTVTPTGITPILSTDGTSESSIITSPVLSGDFGLSMPEELFCGQPESYYNVINGTESSDYLVGTNSPDLIFGNGGNDMINTRGDNNCIYAGDGNDSVLAINNGNTVYGGTGDDFIQLKGTGIAYGEDGNDSTYIIRPSAGHLLDGGDGSDLCVTNARQSINTANCELVKP